MSKTRALYNHAPTTPLEKMQIGLSNTKMRKPVTHLSPRLPQRVRARLLPVLLGCVVGPLAVWLVVEKHPLEAVATGVSVRIWLVGWSFVYVRQGLVVRSIYKTQQNTHTGDKLCIKR